MVQISVVRPGEGELIANGPAQIRILEDGSHTAHRLGIGHITVPPHTPGPIQHRHAQHDEGFYVLSGTVRFTVGPEIRDAEPGTWVLVPPGAPHTFAALGDEPAVILSTFTPDLYVQYFRDLKKMVESGRPMTAETMTPLWSRYATEISAEPAPSRATQTFMVAATLRADTDLDEFTAAREDEHRRLAALRAEGKVGAHHLSPTRRATFLEVIAADEKEAMATLETLPFFRFFDADIYPTTPPDDAERAHRTRL
ncbi:muconolactone Delta-isomerase family protein [Paractinoplanes lichenicola]|uniref:Cupin domain-containing protein n=1 Tax=Paractinoplanes lichenicola TaxID=2802976 RepID=A0ABS1W061_9ACTN|nr:cupin domain-containing protein [Actinoplanes lichenicola]MBL7260094.1 cupin domain-containing protein [Actinoplanes lichenicola]